MHKLSGFILGFLILLFSSTSWADGLTLSHTDPAWKDGKGDVPGKGICRRNGGKGMSPPLKVSNIPEGTVKLLINFTDEDYGSEGGHGAFELKLSRKTEVDIASIQGEGSDKMPPNMKGVGQHHCGSCGGTYYLGPCSGGRGHFYTVYVYAKNADGKELAKGKLPLGQY